MRKKISLLIVTLLCMTMVGQTSLAFEDSQTDPNVDEIMALKEAGILQGGPNGNFNPSQPLTTAAGISMIVKGLDLTSSESDMELLAENDYTNIAEHAWYAEAFMIALMNGLELPSDIDPTQVMTREQFAHLIAQAVDLHGPFAYRLMFIVIEDEADISPEYSSSIQQLLLLNIASLDEQRFYPQQIITRSEAAKWLYHAIQFIENTPIVIELPPIEQSPFYDMTLSMIAINDDISKVTVTAQAPHPGYGLHISSIIFNDDVAIIHTKASFPDPDMMYPQVITEVQATTYISSEYKPVLSDNSRGSDISDQFPGSSEGSDVSNLPIIDRDIHDPGQLPIRNGDFHIPNQ